MGSKLDSCISAPQLPPQALKNSSLSINITNKSETPKRMDARLSGSTMDDEFTNHHTTLKPDYFEIPLQKSTSLNISSRNNFKPRSQSFSLVKNMIPIPNFEDNQKNRDSSYITLKNFKIVRQMNLDAYNGKAYLVSKTNENNVLYVMTVSIKNRSIISYDEILALKRQIYEKNCPFLLRINFCLLDKMKYYIFQKYCPFSDFDSKLQSEVTFTESQAKIFLAQIIIALENLPYNVYMIENIIHFLTLRTLLLSEKGHVVLNVLSIYLKNICNDDRDRYVYYPPEFFLNSMQNSSFSSILAWKIGVFLYKMLCGESPFLFIENFYKKSKSECYKNKEEDINFNTPLKTMNYTWGVKFSRIFSPQAIEFISKLLIKDPDKRLGNKNISDLKKHAFFKEIDFNKIAEIYIEEKDGTRNEDRCDDSLEKVSETEEDKIWN